MSDTVIVAKHTNAVEIRGFFKEKFHSMPFELNSEIIL